MFSGVFRHAAPLAHQIRLATVGFDVVNAQADALVRNPVACPAKNLVEHLVAGMPRSCAGHHT